MPGTAAPAAQPEATATPPEAADNEAALPDPAKSYLSIKAKGGLGNRMLAAVCGLVYADLAGREAVIDWREGSYAPKGVNSYPLLFQSPIETTPEALDAIDDVTPATWQGRLAQSAGDLIAETGELEHRNPLAYRKYCVPLERVDFPEKLAVFWSYLPKFRRLSKALRQDERFRGRDVERIASEYLTRYFTPNARVIETVQGVISKMPRPITGVHIRYTDRKTPLPTFWRLMDKAVAADPGGSIFLATDNGDVEAEARRRYPHVTTIEKWFPESGARIHDNNAAPDMVREAENALIDMYALAEVDRLIYSRHSTFSYTSRLIGDIPAERAYDVDKWNLTRQAKRLIQEYV